MSDEPQNRGNFFCPFLQSRYPSAFICVRKPEFQIHSSIRFFACVSIHILKTHMKKCPSTSQSTINSSFHFISPSCPPLLFFHRQLLQFPFQNPHPISPKYPLTPIFHIHFAPINQFVSPQIKFPISAAPPGCIKFRSSSLDNAAQELRTRD